MRALTKGPAFRPVAEGNRGGFQGKLDFSFNPRHCRSSCASGLLVRTHLILRSSSNNNAIICTLKFIAAFFTTARIFHCNGFVIFHCVCGYPQTHTLFNLVKERNRRKSCHSCDYIKWNKSDTDKYCMNSFLCGI